MHRTLFFLLLALPAYAQSPLHLEAAGSSLSVDGPCASSVRITPDASLQGRAVLDATAANPGELAQLAFTTDQHRARLHIRNEECWSDDDKARTLQIELRIPAGYPVDIQDGGSAEYRIGDTHAALAIDASGSLRIAAGQVGALSLEVSGSGDVEVAGIAEAGHVELSGSGSARIGGGEVRALDVQVSGSGGLHYGNGTISALHLESSGNASVVIDATVGTAAVELSGSGNATIARVTGPVAQEESGSGKLAIRSR